MCPESQCGRFSRTPLTGWNFAGKNLTDASFYRATLTDANLSQANLTDANFGSAFRPGGRKVETRLVGPFERCRSSGHWVAGKVARWLIPAEFAGGVLP